MSDYEQLLGEGYESLYAKYLEDPGRLLRAAPFEVTKGTHLLDLCSGSGAVVRAAIGMGVDPKNITAIEESKAMAFGLHKQAPIHVVHGVLDYLGLYDMLAESPLQPYDLITCRQAVNYWWNIQIVERVVGLLSQNGCFVFNTFNTKPAEVPQTKQYIHNGTQFAEIAYRVGNTVHHVQAREGMPMHLTTFQWITPHKFESDLDALAKSQHIACWDRTRDGTTDTYVVRSKFY